MKKGVRVFLCLCLFALLAAGTGGCLLPETASDFSGEAQTLSIGSPYKHYFQQLTNKEKHAYNAILSALPRFPDSIEIPDLTSAELTRMYTALLYDNPEYFFLNNDSQIRQSKKRTYFYPSYRMGAEDYAAMHRKCTEAAAQIVAQAQAQATVFDRERTVHDCIIAMCSYSDSAANAYKNTIYGVLAGGSAACEGYAKTVKYLLDQLEIPCYVVHGNSTPPGSRTQGHMWNIVQIDGDFYHLDLTWDDPVLEKGGNLLRYTYFNVTDAQIRKTHTEYDAGTACTATKDNFFIHESLLFSDLDDAEKARAADYAAQTISAGSDGFQLRFADKASYEKAQQKLFTQEEIYALLQQIEEKADRTFATDRVSYFSTDTDYSIEIILEQQKGGETNEYAEN